MIEYIRQRIKDKKILILGFGREGQSTLKLFLEAGTAAKLAVGDQKILTASDVGSTEIALCCGKDYQSYIDDYDLVMKSPGIVLEKDIMEYDAEMVSQMQLMFEFYKDRIIGITGTKGKSTTTTLLHHVMKEAGKPVILAGNIGIPVFDIIHDITEESILVLELSCHQLEYMTVSPKWGILLNIYEEHLDHYGTLEKYVASKEKIYVNQERGDTLYVHPSVRPLNGACQAVQKLIEAVDINRKATEDVVVRLCGKQICYGNRKLEIPTDKISLLGAHNYLDIAFVYAVCCDFGIGDEDFLRGLQSYVPLPHRLQYIGCVNGVAYYDDSISTIDETTIQALNTIENADTVLIGGMEREISYVNLEEYLSESKVAHIILMEATGKRIYQEIMDNLPDFKDKERLYLVEHLQDAVKLAKKITTKGGSCILSPAAASYGIFKNFEERGEVFSKLVLEQG
ncbi:MAG: UDP-N-acetylmuramoyl-L-alanine--D-glutamate ligase [Lachnospiraceae bacterium]|nr:UDP-N-acetylmuramoyl-L-alanine--D-glutamate ligase [Lachnospiraceae bacterium]